MEVSIKACRSSRQRSLRSSRRSTTVERAAREEQTVRALH